MMDPENAPLAAEKIPSFAESESQRENKPVDIPSKSVTGDGDIFAWLQALGGFALMFNSWGLVNSFGAFQTHYQIKLLRGTSASQISWIGSVQTFFLIFGGLVTGPLFDRGHFKVLLSTGTFLIVFGMMMTSLCSRYWQVLLAQGFVVGFGCSCFFVPSVGIIPQYFEKRRALALGFVSAGSGLGGLIYTIAFEQLQPSVGFGWATRIIAFICLATLLVPVAAMKWRGSLKKPPMRFDAAIWKDVAFAVFGIATLFNFLGIYIPFFYVQLYALTQQTITGNLNRYLLPIMNVGSVVGRLAPPYLADTIGPLTTIAICTLGTVILAFCWIIITTKAQIIAFSILWGFFSGGFMALGPAVVASLTSDLSLFGARLGMIFIPTSIGVLIGNPIAGALSEHGWLALQSFCGAMVSVAFVGMVTARIWRARSKLFSKV